MKISVNLDVFLSDEEVDYLKKVFQHDHDRTYNSFFGGKYNLDIIKNLIEKGIVKNDSLGNMSLTVLGKSVILEFDRNIRIDKIFNN